MTEQKTQRIWSKTPSVENGPFVSPWIRAHSSDFEIAYAGNSVTAQRNGYQVRLHDLLCQKWSFRSPAIKLALGAVGSMGLASYWEALIRDRRPRAVFLDCSTADMGQATPDADVSVAVIHLLRAIRGIGAEACFLHMPRADQFASRRKQVLAIYSKISSELRVASINLELSDELTDPHLYLYDGVHTTGLGAQAVAEAIADALSSQDYFEGTKRSRSVMEHESHLRLNTRGWHCFDYDPTPSTGTFRLAIPFAEIEGEGSATWTSSTSTLFGLQILLGPHSGVIELTDGERLLRIQTWDESCDQHPRLSYVPIPSELRHAGKIVVRASRKERGERDLFGLASRVSHRGSALRLVGFVESIGHEI